MHFCKETSKRKYDSKFEEFMKQNQSKISETEKEERIKAAQEELDELSRKAHEEAEKAKKKLKDTKQAFEDFSSKTENEEMNLKDVFSNINLKDHIDGASNMFKGVKRGASRGVNSILQMRKALFEKEKKEEVEKIIQEEKEHLDEAAHAKQTDAAKDAAQDEKLESKEEKPEEAEKTEEPTEPKIGRVQRFKDKMSSTAGKIQEKAPFVYKTGVFFKDLWQETFPNDDRKVKTRIQRRREIAKEQKQYSEEEIAQMQEEIPEWKRTAVTMVDEDKVQEEEAGALRRLYRKFGSQVSNTTIAQKIMESEEYKDFRKKYHDIKTEASELKEDFKDEVETTQNPVVGTARTFSDYVFKETDVSRAIAKMKMYDPEFDILDLHYEVEEIFMDLYDNFLVGDLEYLTKFCGEAALAVIKTELMRREKEKWEHKYKELLFWNDANLISGNVAEDGRPSFSFPHSAQEINCKVSIKDPEEIVEGGDEDIERGVYKITLKRHDDPDLSLTGHYWEIVEFEKHEAVKQLV